MAKKRLHSFSWVPDLLHQKDNYFLTPIEKLAEKIELIANCPEVVYNQGELCSCTANAIGESIEYILIKGKKEVLHLLVYSFVIPNVEWKGLDTKTPEHWLETE